MQETVFECGHLTAFRPFYLRQTSDMNCNHVPLQATYMQVSFQLNTAETDLTKVLMLHLFVSQGELLWCSPVQSPLTGIVRDEQREVVITADSTGLVKTWQGVTGQEVASFSAASPHCTLLQYNINDNWFLTVSNLRISGFCKSENSTVFFF